MLINVMYVHVECFEGGRAFGRVNVDVVAWTCTI